MKKIFFILILCAVKVSAQVTLTTVYETPQSQINLYVISQGFTSATMGQFDTFSANFLTKLWNTEPYMSNKPNFRVIIVKDVALVDTYPRAYNQFSPPSVCSGSPVTVADGSESPETFYARMDDLVENFIPDYDQDHSYVIAIFNNLYYTGGGGRYTFATTFCPSYYSYMHDVLIHEFSHSFGLVGDEYNSNSAGVDPNDFPIFHDRNVTTITQPDDIPWKYLIDPSTPIPTCAAVSPCTATALGLYAGANYSTTGWYRATPNCKMRTVTAGFCAVCSDIITEKITEHLCRSNVSVTEDFVTRHQNMTHWRKSVDALQSTSVIGNRISVDYVAQGQIELQPGFESVAGSHFEAVIGDCYDISVRNPYRIKRSNSFYGCSLRPDEPGSVSNAAVAKAVQLYPNPTSGMLDIYLEDDQIESITILSIEGKVVFEKTIGNQYSQIDVGGLANGIYLLNTRKPNGQILQCKFVKD